jgi:SAM-dependent methyltransferase
MGRLSIAQDGLNSAQLKTNNYKYRHLNLAALGAWRWLGILEHKELVSDFVFDDKKVGLDFGGAMAPVSYCVEICDKGDSLHDLEDNAYDYIFSSHTLEHLGDLEGTLEAFRRKVKPGGSVILNLPAYTCTRWRADKPGLFGHNYTFCLEADKENAEGCKSLIAIDTLASDYFKIKIAEMCGDNSIFLELER